MADRKITSPFGENDLAPILATPKSTPEELSEDEYLARYGPPFGPCGHPCDCEDCQAYRERLKRCGPPPKRVPKIEKDDFDKAIEKVLAKEPRDEWRETIRNQRCFVRCWYDEEDRSFCTEMDCDLRDLCESTWESIRGGIEARGDDDSIITPSPTRTIGKRIRKGVRQSPRIPRFKWKGTGKYDRVPYVDQGRPIDHIAHTIWSLLGDPPTLPSDWCYGTSQTKDQEEQARNQFVSVFGTGLYVIRRASYHQYILNGYHLLRIWVNSAGGGWVDCSQDLSRNLLQDAKNMIERTPASGRKTKFRFYPYRVFLSKPGSIERFTYALTKVRGLEYLSKDRTRSG